MIVANQTRGRRKKTVAEKKRNANFRPDRAPMIEMPGRPEKPKGLSRKASAFWNLIEPQLFEAGVCKSIDATQLRHLCEFYADYRTIREAFDAANKTNPDGLIVNLAKWQLALKRSYEAFSKVADSFGLSPVARRKIVETEKPEADPLSTFFDRQTQECSN